jgi:hypothetical protein
MRAAILLIFSILSSGCAVLPPSVDDVASSCTGGKVTSVQTTDVLSVGLLFGLLKFSTQPTRHAECQ